MSSSEILNSPTVFAHSLTSFTSILSRSVCADVVSVPLDTSTFSVSSCFGSVLADLNAFKLSLYNRWKENQIDAKILCFAPIAGTLGESGVTNPVEAFEHGIKLAKERK